MQRNDLTGQRFGRLIALYPIEARRDKCVVWMCQCDCGTRKEIPSSDLTRNRVKSCGCLKRMAKDISGERRGHLTALRPTGEQDERGHAIYLWRCDCGREFERSIQGTSRNTARLCPACRKLVKAGQIDRAREGREVEPDTGLTPRYLLNLVSGVPTARSTSGVRGVYWHSAHRCWCAVGCENGRLVNLGVFDELEQAIEARRNFVRRTYGAAALRLGIELP